MQYVFCSCRNYITKFEISKTSLFLIVDGLILEGHPTNLSHIGFNVSISLTVFYNVLLFILLRNLIIS